MNENKKNCCLSGVGCSVTGCTYHTPEGRCCASSINVQNEGATRKAETFCSTFTPRQGR